jgi:hypothetical protein
MAALHTYTRKKRQGIYQQGSFGKLPTSEPFHTEVKSRATTDNKKTIQRKGSRLQIRSQRVANRGT